MDTSNLKKNPLWFVASAYSVAGRPKAEDATMTYARTKYMYALIPDYMIPHVVKDLQAYSEKLLQENRRLKPVDIRSCPGYNKDHKTIHVGSQSLSLTKVNKVIE